MVSNGLSVLLYSDCKQHLTSLFFCSAKLLALQQPVAPGHASGVGAGQRQREAVWTHVCSWVLVLLCVQLALEMCPDFCMYKARPDLNLHNTSLTEHASRHMCTHAANAQTNTHDSLLMLLCKLLVVAHFKMTKTA